MSCNVAVYAVLNQDQSTIGSAVAGYTVVDYNRLSAVSDKDAWDGTVVCVYELIFVINIGHAAGCIGQIQRSQQPHRLYGTV